MMSDGNLIVYNQIMSIMIDIRLLGQFYVHFDGNRVEINSHPQQALLAYLILNHSVSHPREKLAGLLWPESNETGARRNLRSTLWRLRKVLDGPFFKIDKKSIAFIPPDDAKIDVINLQENVQGEAALEAAIRVYQGELLPGFYEDWVLLERERLQSTYDNKLQALLIQLLSQKEWKRAITWGEKWISLGTVPEPAYRALMTAHAGLGDLAAVVTAYQRCRAALAKDLAVEPSVETKTLLQELTSANQTAYVEYSEVSHEQSSGSMRTMPPLGKRYIIERELAVGGQGILFLGRDTISNKQVVIKQLKPELMTTDSQHLERFMREGQALRQLSHPNIVGILATFERDGQPHIVMEYVHGGSLRDLLVGEGRLSLKETIDISLELADALTRAHHLKIIHRDLKPENILLTEDHSPRLTDFGIARLIRAEVQLTQIGTILGSPSYLSPEAIRGEEMDERSDIWSFGVVLYEMLTGRRPFVAERMSAVISSILNDPLPEISQYRDPLPASLISLLRSMLEKERERRIPTMRQVAARLEAIRDHIHEISTEQPAVVKGDKFPIYDPSFITPPAFLQEDDRRPRQHPFVARQKELALLNKSLEQVLDGRGQVVFVTGDAGSGKSALLSEFASQAQDSHSDLVVALGNCNAYTGRGDPYLPFRDLLSLLTGDVETKWAGGVITGEQARRLLGITPITGRMLFEKGSNILETVVSGRTLVSRLAQFVPPETFWLRGLQEQVAQEEALLKRAEADQTALFEQMTHLFLALSSQFPLLLILDDLQWADSASIELLFHLGRRLVEGRIMIAGIYREDELELGRADSSESMNQRHPLLSAVNELQRVHGRPAINLDMESEAEGKAFVEAYLDSEPNNFNSQFRYDLLQHTGGHPLFTVELMHHLQERGDLVLNEKGERIATPNLAWRNLPVRVEAVIDQRIGRLNQELRELLIIACVEGIDFSAQVIAALLNLDERHVVRKLSRECDRKHRLVREQGYRQLNGRRLHQYRFRHILYQQHLYNSLTEMERSLLHEDVGLALEALCGEDPQKIAPRLAWHFTKADLAEKAIPYLLQAGDQARRRYAHHQAIQHYQQAIPILREQAEHEQLARTYMKLGLTYHNAFDFQHSREAYEDGFFWWQRAGEFDPNQERQPARQPLRLAVPEPVTLDPGRYTDDASAAIMYQLFSGLVTLSPNMSVLPDIAHSWEVFDNGRQYLFHLREDAFWSDGVPLSAGDFAFAWKRMIQPGSSQRPGNYLYDIKGARAYHEGRLQDDSSVGIRAVDDKSLLVTLDGPTSYLPQLLTVATTFPIPRHAVQKYGPSWSDPKHLVSNGPFSLRSWEQGEQAILERNPRYHGRFLGNLERVHLRFYNLPQAELLQHYIKGDLDTFDLASLSRHEQERTRQRFAGEYVSGPHLSTTYLGFDVQRAPFTDSRIRQAFALAINCEDLADMIRRGTDFPATGGLVSPGMPGHSPDIAPGYNPQAARELLAEAGFLNGEGFPDITLMLTRLDGPQQIGLYIQEQLAHNLNISIALDPLEWHRFQRRLLHHPSHMWIMGWSVDYPDPDNFLRVSDWRVNTGWHNEAFDQLLEMGCRTTDQEERILLYQKADQIITAEAPIVPLLYKRFHLLVKPWVSQIPTSPVVRNFLKDVVKENN